MKAMARNRLATVKRFGNWKDPKRVDPNTKPTIERRKSRSRFALRLLFR